MDIFEGIFEQRLLTLSEVFIYKVPPLRSASGHRAEEWGLDSPLFTGCVKIFQADTKLRIVLYQYKDATCRSTADDNITEFAECPVELKPKELITGCVDAVIDSSRYYVLKVKDPKSTRSTLIGIGFRERDYAFDFKSVLNDYCRYVDRMDLAANGGKSSVPTNVEDGLEDLDINAPTSQVDSNAPKRDLAIKAGEKIKIATKGLLHANKPKQDTSSSSSTVLISPEASKPSKIKAPPSGVLASLSSLKAYTSEQSSAAAAGASSGTDSVTSVSSGNTSEAEDWGDFETA